MSSRQSIGVIFAKRRNCQDCDIRAVSLAAPGLPLSSSGPPTTSSNTSTAASSTAQAVTSTTTTPTESPSPVVATTSPSTSNAGTIAGAVIGGVVFLVLVLLGILLYLRARKRKRTPPSYEFMNALKAGATPVLRLDSGAEYTPTLPEKGGGYTHHPPVPLPFMQDSYYTSPPMQSMRFPDAMMTMTDIPSERPSVDTPLHPQRFSSQQVNNSFVAQHHPNASVGSRKELWGSEAEIASGELSPVRQSPRDAVSHFAPRISLDEPSTQPLYPSRSPTSLQPLRRQPDVESVGHV